jgi:hypothetical protein
MLVLLVALAVPGAAQETWTPTSTMGAPSVRVYHTAVWAGSKMIVWGGWDTDYTDTGGIYDPAVDTWSATSTTNAPSARYGHTAVWTGSKMIVWGGSPDTGLVSTGGVYSNPALLSPPADFFTVTPCRLVDTRSAAGPLGGPALGANTSRAFVVVGSCGIPLAAEAVATNLTAVSPTAGGHLSLSASGIPPTGTSSLNYAAHQTRADNAFVALGPDGAFVVYASQPSGTTHLVVDVTGYFGTPGCSPAQTPGSPELTVNTGTRTLTWPPVPGATSYNVYVKAVVGECGLLGPQIVTRSDQKLSNVSSPLDISAFNRCEACYFVDASAVSGECESRLRSDDGHPTFLGFGLLPCSP